MYRLKINRSAERDLRNLPRSVFQRINRTILALREEPRPAGVRKLRGERDSWRVRVGDYRIVYRIDDNEAVIMIVRVRHRRDVYR